MTMSDATFATSPVVHIRNGDGSIASHGPDSQLVVNVYLIGPGTLLGNSVSTAYRGSATFPSLKIVMQGHGFAGRLYFNASTTTSIANGSTPNLACGPTGCMGPPRSLLSPEGESISIYTAPATPATPTLHLEPGVSSVALSWTGGHNGGSVVTSWIVYKQAAQGVWDSGRAVAVGADGVGATGATGYTYTGLQEGTSYGFKVAAVNAAGAGPQSGFAGPFTTAVTPTSAPTAAPTAWDGFSPTAVPTTPYPTPAPTTAPTATPTHAYSVDSTVWIVGSLSSSFGLTLTLTLTVWIVCSSSDSSP